jgi:hypothetical protein
VIRERLKIDLGALVDPLEVPCERGFQRFTERLRKRELGFVADRLFFVWSTPVVEMKPVGTARPNG